MLVKRGPWAFLLLGGSGRPLEVYSHWQMDAPCLVSQAFTGQMSDQLSKGKHSHTIHQECLCALLKEYVLVDRWLNLEKVTLSSTLVN